MGSGAGEDGSVRGVSRRRWDHFKNLQAGTHGNRHFQAAWNKYGVARFRFVLLELCPPEKCLEREQWWIDHYDAANREVGLNLCPCAWSTLGFKHSEETCQKRSEHQKERWKDEEYRKSQSAALKGRQVSPETRNKASEAVKRYFAENPDARHRRAESQSELWKDPEYRANQVAKRLGQVHSPESIARVAAANRGKKRSPEFCENLSRRCKGKKRSEETKRKLKEAAKNRWNGPDAEENRRKMSEAVKAMSNESRQKMSDSAKKRHDRERAERLSQ